MTSSNDYVSTQLLTTSINIQPDKIQGDINQLILHTMKQRYEGVCNKDGYIKKDSIELVERSIGEIKTIDSQSFVVYNITYRADVLSPAQGVKLDIIVDSITKMGVVGFIQLAEDDTIKFNVSTVYPRTSTDTLTLYFCFVGFTLHVVFAEFKSYIPTQVSQVGLQSPSVGQNTLFPCGLSYGQVTADGFTHTLNFSRCASLPLHAMHVPSKIHESVVMQ